MGEEAGYVAFTALHVPLYALLLRGLFVVHVVLHLLFINHPEYGFRSTFSWTLILGAGAFGAVDLLTLL